MSKRTERREAERAARKLAYQQSRQQTPATANIAQTAAAPSEPELLERAQAFFNQTAEKPAAQTRLRSPIRRQPSQRPALHRRQHTGRAKPSPRATTPFTASPPSRRRKLPGPPLRKPIRIRPVLAAYRNEWKPVTATETDLVNRMVMHRWLRLRALRLQQSLFDTQTGDVSDIKRFDLYRRYETTHERSYNKCLADLQRLRAFQLRQQNGFESQRRKNEEHELKMQRLKQQEDLMNQKILAAEARLSRLNPAPSPKIAKLLPPEPPKTAPATASVSLKALSMARLRHFQVLTRDRKPFVTHR